MNQDLELKHEIFHLNLLRKKRVIIFTNEQEKEMEIKRKYQKVKLNDGENIGIKDEIRVYAEHILKHFYNTKYM